MEGRAEREEDEERRHLGGSGLVRRRDAAGGGRDRGGDSSWHPWPTVDGPPGPFGGGIGRLRPQLLTVGLRPPPPPLGHLARPPEPSSFSRIRPL